MRTALTALALSVILGLTPALPVLADGQGGAKEPTRYLLVGWVAETKGALKADQTGLNRPLLKGSALVFKDTITVGPEGMATLVFKDGTRMMLEADSRLRIDQLSFGSGHNGASISVMEGSMRLEPGRIATKTKGRVIVQTPAAMVHAQGPVYVNHRGGLSTVKLTGKGLAKVTSSKGEVMLNTPESETTAEVEHPTEEHVSTL